MIACTKEPPIQLATKLKVLVVDDEPDVLLGLRLLMESVGKEVRTARSGREALDVLRDWEPHLLLSDITMEGMSGLELLDIVKKRNPNIKVILITGYGTIELAVSALQRGAAHFITKPFDNEDILSSTRRYGLEALVEEMTRETSSSESDTHEIIAEDPRTRKVLELVNQVAPTGITVLIQGGSGSGKELIARAIHDRSPHQKRPFIPVNSAAIPDTLLESELFGHQKGAFTGADKNRAGLFELVKGGTIFLDEMSHMSSFFQSKLLRVLEDKIVTPLGSTQPRPVDFRLIVASSIDLKSLVQEGNFLAELYFRLNVVTIEIPPLKSRPGDIPALAAHFMAKYAQKIRAESAPTVQISAEALRAMQRHSWPGNVRELENCIQRALVLCREGQIRAFHLGLDCSSTDATRHPGEDGLSYEQEKQKALEFFQRSYIEETLKQAKGNITHASKACGLTRAAFQRIMRGLNIERDVFLVHDKE